MLNNQIFSEIMSLVSTKDDFNIIDGEINILSESLFKLGQNSFESALKNSVSKETSEIVSKLVLENDKKEVISSLKEILKKAEFVELVVAVELSSKFTTKIASLVKKSISQNAVLDIKVDKNVIAGAIFSFRGKYLDLSINKKLEEILKNYV